LRGPAVPFRPWLKTQPGQTHVVEKFVWQSGRFKSKAFSQALVGTFLCEKL